MVKMLRAPAVPARGPTYNELRDALRRLVDAGQMELYNCEPHTRGKNEWLRSLLQAKETLSVWEEADRP